MRINLVLALLLMLIILSATAESLLIEPLDDINLVADGGFETIVFTVINDENISINIYINTTLSLNGLVFLENEITVPANSTVNVSCVILKEETATGKISFNYNSITTEVNVDIGEGALSDNITIIPSQPTSESNIVFLLPTREDATGYMICQKTNRVYIIAVKDGIGFVELGDDYGEVYVAIFSKEKRYVAEFTIDAYFQEELTIDMPSATVINEVTMFQVFASGTPIQAEVRFSIGEKLISKTTDSNGEVSIEFNEVGEWMVTAKVFNVETVKNIYVAEKPIDITIPEDIYVDEEVEISAGKKSEITIYFRELIWSTTTDDSGKFIFTPTIPGKHTLNIVAEDLQEASKDFVVHAETFISVKDKDKDITSIKPHTLYAIYVKDKNDKPVESTLEIYGDGILLDERDIAGSTIWESDTFFFKYEFKVSPSGGTGYVENILTLNGREDTFDIGGLMPGIAVVIALAVVALIYLFKREWLFSVHRAYRSKIQNMHKPKIPL